MLDAIEVTLVAEDAARCDALWLSLAQRGLRVAVGAKGLGMDPRLVLLVGDADYCLHTRHSLCRDRLGRLVPHYMVALLPFGEGGRVTDLLSAGFDDVVCGIERVYEVALRLELGHRRAQEPYRTVADCPERSSSGDKAPEEQGFGAVGTLAAGVAHEINNPLTYIRGNLEYALQALNVGKTIMIEQDLVDALTDAREGTVRVADIVSSLKTFSRVDTDDVPDGPSSLPRVLAVAMRLTRNEIRHCADLKVEGLDTLPRVRGSKARLVHAFVNLLLNAAQAIERRAAGRGLIMVTGKVVRESAVVEIRDNGVGVPPEQQRRVFEPFYSTRPVGQGRGLGLPVAHNLIARAGGRLELESSPDWGSVLRVTLPVAGPSMPVTWSTAPEMLAAASLRILVVDDERSVLTMLRRMLTVQHVVAIASTVLEARAMLARQRYDAVLCDLMMPEGGGRSVYEQALEVDGSYRDRFVFMTGGAFREEEEAFADLHTQRTLNKPIEFAALQSLLRDIPARN